MQTKYFTCDNKASSTLLSTVLDLISLDNTISKDISSHSLILISYIKFYISKSIYIYIYIYTYTYIYIYIDIYIYISHIQNKKQTKQWWCWMLMSSNTHCLAHSENWKVEWRLIYSVVLAFFSQWWFSNLFA